MLVVEDGPTLTHGGMRYGAGMVAARKCGAAEIVDPRPYVVGESPRRSQKYPGIGTLLPAMGYGDAADARTWRRRSRACLRHGGRGTPIDLRRVVEIEQPTVRVHYDLQEIGRPTLADAWSGFFRRAAP